MGFRSATFLFTYLLARTYLLIGESSLVRLLGKINEWFSVFRHNHRHLAMNSLIVFACLVLIGVVSAANDGSK